MNRSPSIHRHSHLPAAVPPEFRRLKEMERAGIGAVRQHVAADCIRQARQKTGMAHANRRNLPRRLQPPVRTASVEVNHLWLRMN